jgi:UDPglucose 6-dehydrogenase
MANSALTYWAWISTRRGSARSRRKLPFHEPDLEPLLERGLRSGRLRFTTLFQEAAEFGDVHFCCVGTPQRTDSGGADLSQLFGGIDALAPLLERPCLIFGKSTTPVGTAGNLAERVARLAPVGAAAELAWNPEFLREGHAVTDTLRPERIVAGVRSATAERSCERCTQPRWRRRFFKCQTATEESEGATTPYA